MSDDLNKKLAEWVGLRLAGELDYTGFYMFADSEGIAHHANFTESLDACFKWLIPEVYKRCGQGATQALLEIWGLYISLGAYWRKEAKALCFAIEKLIDIEKSNKGG